MGQFRLEVQLFLKQFHSLCKSWVTRVFPSPKIRVMQWPSVGLIFVHKAKNCSKWRKERHPCALYKVSCKRMVFCCIVCYFENDKKCFLEEFSWCCYQNEIGSWIAHFTKEKVSWTNFSRLKYLSYGNMGCGVFKRGVQN